MPSSSSDSSDLSSSESKHKKHHKKDEAKKKKSHRKHHHRRHHHHHKSKDKKSKKIKKEQQKESQEEEFQDQQLKIQLHAQALIQAQQSQNQQLMKINFLEQPAHPGYQINDINYIMPELQFQYRHARRLYIGNLPENLVVQQLIEFLWGAMKLAGGLLEPGNPIINTDLFSPQKFLFLELRSIEETDAFLQLDGIIFSGKSLRFRRPKDYDKYPVVKGSRAVPTLNLNQIGLCAIPTVVNEGPNKLFIGGIPLDFDEGSVIQFLKLKEFGNLQGFHLVKDGKTNKSKGYAFLEYIEPEDADRCIKELDGMHIMGRTLQCKRAEQNMTVKEPKLGLNINYSDIMSYTSQYSGMQQMTMNQPIMPNIIHPQNSQQQSFQQVQEQQKQYQQPQQQQQFGANVQFAI